MTNHFNAVMGRNLRSVSLFMLTLLAWNRAGAQTPAEVSAVAWCTGTTTCLQWTADPIATSYDVIRGTPGALPALLNGGVDSCGRLVVHPPVATGLSESPAAGQFFWYLVTASNVCAQGTPGSATPGPRIVDSSGNCDPSCSNAVIDGNESDVDCGGPTCASCPTGESCVVSNDCSSHSCLGNSCQAPTCSDGVRNGTETAVDCGGPCAPCFNGAGCCVANDCQSATCSNGVCVISPCMNGAIDGNETDVDCGGGTCPPCGNNLHCVFGSDCVSHVCSPQGTCQPPTCTDTVQNGAETDLDCGGSVCPPCVNTKHCLVGTDCQSGNCQGGTCQPALLPNGSVCSSNAQCQSGSCVDGVCCNTACNGVCQACTAAKKGNGTDGTCGNVSNGTDPDNECAGAATCNGSGACSAPNGTVCVLNGDCQSGNCVDGVCCNSPCSGLCQACTAAKKGNGTDGTCGNISIGSDPDNECPGTDTCNGSGACSLPIGSACTLNPQCQSGNCIDGVCCNTVCNGVCQACSAAKKGSGSNGTCGSISNGTDPDNECAGAATCNGSGACIAPDGALCTSNPQCQSGNCIDGVCCNTACNGVCQACTAAKKGSGSNGTCGNISNGTDPDNECAGASTCNGAGACGP